MDFDDISNILRKVEHKIKDVIHIQALLPFLDLSHHSRQQIEAQLTQQGSPFASSTFFQNINSRPESSYKLVAALLHQKVNQKGIHDILLKEIRKHFRNKPRKLNEVLNKINEEKRRLGVREEKKDEGPDEAFPTGSTLTGAAWSKSQDSGPDSDGDNGGGASGGPPRSGLQTPLRGPGTQPSPKTSPDSNTDDSLPSLPGGGSAPAQVVYRRQQPQPEQTYRSLPVGPTTTGQGIALNALKSSVHRGLAKCLEELGDDGFPMWMVILEDENLDLNISQAEQEKIEENKKQGTAFMKLLHSKGYTLSDLEGMFNAVNMAHALGILRQHQNAVVPAPRVTMATNNLNISGGQDKVDNTNKLLNIGTGADDDEKRCASLPSSLDRHTGPQPELQPVQVTRASTGSLRDVASYNSSLSSSCSNSSSDVNTRTSHPVQSVSDPENKSSEPNASMDYQKLVKDVDNVSLNSSNSSFMDVQGKTPSERAIAPPNTQPSNTQPSTITPNIPISGPIPTTVSDQDDTYTPSPSSTGSDNSSDNRGTTQPVTGVSGNISSSVSSSTSADPDDSSKVVNRDAAARGPIIDLSTAGSLITSGISETVSSNIDSSFSTYSESSYDDRVSEFINRDATATGGESLSMSISNDSVIEENSMKGTRALQPTSERDVFVPDATREAQKLREERVHACDEHPSALRSFEDIQRPPDKGQGVTARPEDSQTGSQAEVQSSGATTLSQLKVEDNMEEIVVQGEALGESGGNTEENVARGATLGERGGDTEQGSVEENVTGGNIPDLSVFESENGEKPTEVTAPDQDK